MARRLLLLVLSLALAVVALGVVPMGSAHGQVPPPLPPLPPGDDEPEEAPPQHPPLPPDSGSGRRVVYSLSEQRVWIVESDERASDSWLVSGRKGIPKPGTYSVFSRSRWSSANGGRVRMEFMVRFVKTRRSAIGFHAIPVDRRGRPVQSESELGQPRSRGCVRQARPDAEHLWHWAPIGTAVRVTS